jgi:hypothetical protein
MCTRQRGCFGGSLHDSSGSAAATSCVTMGTYAVIWGRHLESSRAMCWARRHVRSEHEEKMVGTCRIVSPRRGALHWPLTAPHFSHPMYLMYTWPDREGWQYTQGK